MYLIRLGGRVISFDHLISVVNEEVEPGPPPGGARVTLEQGERFYVDRAAKELLDRHLEQVLIPDPAEKVLVSTARGIRLNPITGEPLPFGQERHEGG